jgi:hypothetical protein
LDHIKHTKYDEVAIESYRIFCMLRDQGEIPHGVRFQVSVPNPTNSVFYHVDYAYRERVEPLYMERLMQDLRRPQDTIPAHDLADATIEPTYLEYEGGRLQDTFFKPHFSSLEEVALENLSKLSSAVDQEVQFGFHLCYGDIQHQHFVQPEDAGRSVGIATGIA